MRAKTEDSRAAIRREALVVFCMRGYRATTLEEIGARVGVTRGAVLHHFVSKADLLQAVVAPFRGALTRLVDEARLNDPPTVQDQKQLLSALVKLFLEHRAALQLLVTDVAARIQVGQLGESATQIERLATLLLGRRPNESDQIRTSAALGAMIQPVAFLGLELNTVSAQRELVAAALAVLTRPATKSPKASASPAAPAAHREQMARQLHAVVR